MVNAAKKDGALEMGLKTTYSAPKYTVVSTLSQAGKVRREGAPAADCPWASAERMVLRRLLP